MKDLIQKDNRLCGTKLRFGYLHKEISVPKYFAKHPWTFSMKLPWYLYVSHQTLTQYSSLVLIRAQYKSFIITKLLKQRQRVTPSNFKASEEILQTRELNVKKRLMFSCIFTYKSRIPYGIHSHKRKFFLVRLSILHLETFRLTPFQLHYLHKRKIYLCKNVQSPIVLIRVNIFISSAKNSLSQHIQSRSLLIKSKKKQSSQTRTLRHPTRYCSNSWNSRPNLQFQS